MTRAGHTGSMYSTLIIVTVLVCAATSSTEEDLCSAAVIGYSQDDPELVELVKKCYLLPPPSTITPYNFTEQDPIIRGQVDQPIIVDLIYNKTTFDGFFLEAGAWDGESLSNSLHLELHRGWGGLLVEPSSKGFHQLGTKNRKAWSTRNCLSTERRPTEGRLSDRGMLGGVTRAGEGEVVVCLPLYTLLLALDNPTVHYLSLDIEGVEMDVLETVPWDKVDNSCSYSYSYS